MWGIWNANFMVSRDKLRLLAAFAGSRKPFSRFYCLPSSVALADLKQQWHYTSAVFMKASRAQKKNETSRVTLDHRRKSRSAKRTKKNSKNISLKFLWLAFRKILANSFFAVSFARCLHLQSFSRFFFGWAEEEKSFEIFYFVFLVRSKHTCFGLLIDGALRWWGRHVVGYDVRGRW